MSEQDQGGLGGLAGRLNKLLGREPKVGTPASRVEAPAPVMASEPAASAAEAPVPEGSDVSGKTGTVAGDVQKGMGQLVEGLDASFEDKAREYAGRIAAGEDPKTMGVPGPLQARVGELVAQNRATAPEPQAGVAAPAPVAPAETYELPEWMRAFGPVAPDAGKQVVEGKAVAAPTLDAEPPEAPKPSAKVVAPELSVPDAWEIEFKYFRTEMTEQELEEKIRWAKEEKEKGLKTVFFTGLPDTIIGLDTYLDRTEKILADKKAGAAPKDKGKDGVSPEEEAETASVSFVARVEAAGGLVEGAVKEAGGLPKKIAGDLEVADKMRRTDRETGLRIEEIPEEELREARGALVKLRAPDFYLKFLDDSIALQKQYRLGAEMAAAVEESMRAATKELKPGWFEKEPAVAREMAELQAFFDRSGNAEELRGTIAEIENEKKGRAWKNGGITAEYKRKEEAELARAKADLAMLESADKFMARADMPKTLREAIATIRAGKEIDFGTGPVDNFRQRVYESVVSTLGIEAVPAVGILEAARVAAAPAPEPEPTPAAPVETVEQIRQRAEREFFGDTRIPEADEMSGGQRQMVEGIRDRKRQATQAALGLAQRAEANPDQREDILAVAKQTVGMVLRAAEAERDTKKRKEMIVWTREFVGALEGTSLAGGLSGRALDGLIGLIVAQLSGK